MQDSIQDRIQSKGEEILTKIENQPKSSIFSKDFWYGSVMDWSMKNDQFKTNMFRFVDVLPSLTSSQEVTKHIKEYFAQASGELPPVFNVGLGLGSLAPSLMSGAIKKNITSMAKMFISGENPKEALQVLKKARKNKMTFTIDILGEATLSESEARDYQSRYLELLQWLAQDAKSWEEVPLIDRDASGPIPKVNISVKLTALYSQINLKDWESTKSILKERLSPILKSAIENQVFVNLDMEYYAVKDLTLDVFEELLFEPEFRSYPFFGCVIQAYLRDSYSDIQRLVDYSKRRGAPFTVRLVKGAYWDFELIKAKQNDWPIPVYTKKQESDANYENCARLLLQNSNTLRSAFASHNVRTIAACLTLAEEYHVLNSDIEIQMLYGMADGIKKTLVDMNYRVRDYAPIGELLPGMAYLVRRLLENTSNESWLRGKFSEGKSALELLRDPSFGLTSSSEIQQKEKGQFYNEPLLDFSISQNRDEIRKCLEARKRSLPVSVQAWINSELKTTESVLVRLSPNTDNMPVARVTLASQELAEAAAQSAYRNQEKWRKTAPEARISLLRKLAAIMQKRRFELIATQILETGKPWSEADADVAEAIDFCLYYARDMERLSVPQRAGQVPGETSLYTYRARGVTLVIAPWNFPLAIITGMATAALVAGNTVILKPAEQSSLVAWELMQMILEAGFPDGVVQFVPGLGEVVGEYLVEHPLVANIAFTGSKAVGLRILEKANQVKPNQKHVKRCIVEMGGKNAIIIDNDADLDEAVAGVLYSAFGFSGQKCSAASRVIVLDEVYERFSERLHAAAQSISIMSAEHPAAYLGPVVDQESQMRILHIISENKKKFSVLFQAENTPQKGCYVPPTIFSEVDPNSRLAQEEIFGPVLALIRAKDLNQAVLFANNTEYALTGGLYSRSPESIATVQSEVEVGNLYVNRGITGAMVDRHPFGGYKMSGVGSKTGGPDYLRQFMEPICITENTMRRGFAPEVS